MTHPGQKWFVMTPFIVIFVIGVLWGSYDFLIKDLNLLWFWAGLGLLVVLSVWAAVSATVRRIFVNIGTALQHQPFRGISIALLLTGTYSVVVYAFMGPIRTWLQHTLLIDPMWVTAIVAIIGFAAAAPLIVLYKPTGIPVEEKTLQRSGLVLSLLVFIIAAFVTNERPNRFFDLETGRPTFMVAKKEGKVYRIDPINCVPNGCFSPATGERLLPGTPEDAERFSNEPWTVGVSRVLEQTATNDSPWFVVPPAPRVQEITGLAGKCLHWDLKNNSDRSLLSFVKVVRTQPYQIANGQRGFAAVEFSILPYAPRRVSIEYTLRNWTPNCNA